jgi:hypothetical protein
MGSMRKWWVDAKKKIKAKDWESKIKFKDDFGPMLDKYEKRYEQIHKLLSAIYKLIGEQEKAAKLIATTATSYKLKVEAAEKQFSIFGTDKANLTKALDDIVGLAGREMGSNKNFLDLMSRYAKIVENELG